MAQRSTWDWIQLLGGLGLGIGTLLWFLSSVQWGALQQALLALHAFWLLAALGLVLSQYVLHAWRWGVLLKHVDSGISARLLWSSTAVLWGFNTVMPLRAGNLLRPLVISRARNLAYPAVLFATVAEYVFDGFAILGMVLWLVWLMPPGQNLGPIGEPRVLAQTLAVSAALLFGMVVLLSTRQAYYAVQATLRPIPSPWLRERLLELFEQLVAGMESVSSPLRFLQASALTAGVWLAWLGGLVCTLKAFSLNLPLVAAVCLEAALTVAMMVPQAPGFLGVFQKVTEEVLVAFDAPSAESQGVALVFWCVCFVPITVAGLVEGARHGVGTQVDT